MNGSHLPSHSRTTEQKKERAENIVQLVEGRWLNEAR